MENGNKDTTKNYVFFTFPVKFLWVPQEGLPSRLQLIIGWSAWDFIKRKFDIEKGDHNLAEKACHRKFNLAGCGFDYFRECYETLQKSAVTGEKDILTSVKSEYLFEAMKGKMEPGLFLFMAAVRSTIGLRRNFTLTYRKAISFRMYGNADQLKRYTIDKFFETASRRKMVSMVWAGRGYYVSTRHKPTELVAAIERRVKDFKSKKQERSEAAHKIAALKRTSAEPQPAHGPEHKVVPRKVPTHAAPEPTMQEIEAALNDKKYVMYSSDGLNCTEEEFLAHVKQWVALKNAAGKLSGYPLVNLMEFCQKDYKPQKPVQNKKASGRSDWLYEKYGIKKDQ